MKKVGTLEILVGISGSGKSTYSREQQEKNPNIRIVNRDKIRELIFGYTEENVVDYYDRPDIRHREKDVTSFEDTVIYDFLESGRDVIVDATHLNVEYLRRFKYWNVKTSIKVFEISLDLCKLRNSDRTRNVPDEILQRQWHQLQSLIHNDKFKELNFDIKKIDNENKPFKCIVVDIDGTLAHKGDRNPFDWNKVKEDVVDPAVRLVTNAVNDLEDVKVFIATGRDGICIDLCNEWLDEENIMYNDIFIRPENDMRPDWVVKEEIWDKLNKDGYEIVAMFDDRLQVVRRARMLGYKVFHVEYNNF